MQTGLPGLPVPKFFRVDSNNRPKNKPIDYKSPVYLQLSLFPTGGRTAVCFSLSLNVMSLDSLFVLSILFSMFLQLRALQSPQELENLSLNLFEAESPMRSPNATTSNSPLVPALFALGDSSVIAARTITSRRLLVLIFCRMGGTSTRTGRRGGSVMDGSPLIISVMSFTFFFFFSGFVGEIFRCLQPFCSFFL